LQIAICNSVEQIGCSDIQDCDSVEAVLTYMESTGILSRS